jgi:dipeptidyl aminopeptidase/acylaminoacyl peptidase
VRGQPTDARSDIFSLGAILYEMLSGKRAFRGDSAVETMSAILNAEPPDLSATNRNVAPGLERIVRHCLEKSPDERFHSARDLAFDLESLSGLSGQSPASPATSGRRSVRGALGAAALVLLGGALATAWMVLRRHEPSAPSFTQLTFRRGEVFDARFAPDGRTVVYSASWESAPPEIFTVRTDSTESRTTGLVVEKLLAVSSKGELAVLLGDDKHPSWESAGTLARVPRGGGTPRELIENVALADWGPDGTELAVVRRLPSGRTRVEYPIGRTLYEFLDFILSVRVSPTGDRVALLESDATGNQFVISVVDRNGKRTVVPGQWNWVSHVLWSPRGDELILQGGHSISEGGFRAVSLSGRERVLVSQSLGLELEDVAADGRLLVTQELMRNGILCHRRGEIGERELGWLDGSLVTAIAADGSAIAFAEVTRDPPPKRGVYLRRTDGSPAMRLGDGLGWEFSADGQWVFAFTHDTLTGQGVVLLPTGTGTPRTIPIEGVKEIGTRLLPDNKGYLIKAERDGAVDLFVMGPEGGTPRPLHAPEVGLGAGVAAVSPDGQRMAYWSGEHHLRTMSFSGGDSRLIPGPPFGEDSVLDTWSEDGRFLYIVRQMGHVPSHIDRLEIATGRREQWKTLIPEDPSGVRYINPVVVTPDGQSYAYSYGRILTSNLFVVDNVH